MVSKAEEIKSEKSNSETGTIATELASKLDESVDTFDALKLKPDLTRGIYGIFSIAPCFLIANSIITYGFESPSSVQQKGFPAMLKGKDLIAQAQPRSGKTTLFAISILQIIDHSSLNCQALVLVPKGELALQIQRVMKALGEDLQVSIHACSASIGEDLKILKRGVQIVVGTPGRIN